MAAKKEDDLSKTQCLFCSEAAPQVVVTEELYRTGKFGDLALRSDGSVRRFPITFAAHDDCLQGVPRMSAQEASDRKNSPHLFVDPR